MNFTQSIAHCFSNYANFNGRGSRSEYWWFYLFTWLLNLGGTLMDSSMGESGEGLMYWGTALVTVIPTLSAGARRLHDVNKSGGYLFLSLIPTIGSIILLFMLIPEGDKGKNRFGINPLNKKNKHKKIKKVKKWKDN